MADRVRRSIGRRERATYLAPLLGARGCRVAGIFLSGMNEERITDAYHRFQPGRDFLSTPIFLNSGVEDLVATLDQQNAVEKSMRRTGFTNIRHTAFPGGHELPPARLLEGLRWLRKDCSDVSAVGVLPELAIREILSSNT